jgi:hypothetical protein
VPTVHDLIEDRDRNLVLAVVVEDDEVPGHNICVAGKTSSTRWPGTGCRCG